jgi:hypothetical protein
MAYNTQSFSPAPYRGEDVTPTFTPDDLPADDVTTWTLGFTAWHRATASSDDPAISKASGSGVSVLSSSAKTFQVAIASADTADLTPGLYGWELWRTDGGSRKLLAAGTFELLKARRTFA